MSRSLLTNETSELDLLDQRPFDQTDFDILKSYEAVVDGLAMLIGSHCEIVLHSLLDLNVQPFALLTVNIQAGRLVRQLLTWRYVCCTI